MADETPVRTVLREFIGLATNANPHRLPAGAMVEQVNIKADKVGELTVRNGLREVTFDN